MSVAIYVGGLVSILKDEDASGWTGGVALFWIWRDQNYSLFDIPYGLSYMFGAQHPGPEFLRAPHRGFYFITGALFYLTNCPYRLVTASLNCFAGALTVVFSAMTAGRLFGNAVSRRTGWYVCFFPSMVIWSALTIKEPIVICVETIIIFNCICIMKRSSLSASLVCAVLLSVLLIPFRFYCFWMFGFLTILSVLMPDWSSLSHGQSLLYKRFALLCLPFVLYFAYQRLRVELDNQKFDLEYVQAFRGSVSQGGEINGAGSGVERAF